MRNKQGLSIIALLLVLVVTGSSPLSADDQSRPVYQLTVDGVIGPAVEDYLARGLQKGNDSNAELIVIRMDTPGGLDSSMRGIIKNITASAVPVVSFVNPGGARAASAGTFILYASHIAAMSPGTNLGAATPVQIGGLSPSKKDPDSQQQPAMDASKQKAINDAVAYIRSLAQLRGRNQQWAEQAVREAASLPAKDALKQNVIDIVASDMVDLLKQLDGREVVVLGHSRLLQTTGKTLTQYEPDWRSRLLGIITNPNIAYVLMLVGIYGLIFEFSSPGAIVPGTVGAICLLLALYAFQLLPINYAGMALILLGIALMVAEAYQPSFGVLGIGGVLAFVIGSIILMDTEAPGFGIDIPVIATFAISSVLMFVVVVGMALKARRRPVVSGMEQLLGSIAIVVEDFDGQGRVSVHSESWNAVSDEPLHKQQQVLVTGVDGLVLRVKPLSGSRPKEDT